MKKEELKQLAQDKGFESALMHWDMVSKCDCNTFHLWMCELQKWLRDEHRMDVQPICTYKQFRFYHLGIIFINENNQVDTIILKDEGMPTKELFNSYELALESGLTEALKLI